MNLPLARTAFSAARRKPECLLMSVKRKQQMGVVVYQKRHRLPTMPFSCAFTISLLQLLYEIPCLLPLHCNRTPQFISSFQSIPGEHIARLPRAAHKYHSYIFEAEEPAYHAVLHHDRVEKIRK